MTSDPSRKTDFAYPPSVYSGPFTSTRLEKCLFIFLSLNAMTGENSEQPVMERQSSRVSQSSKLGGEHEHHHVHIPAPFKVPEVLGREGAQDGLPAEADQRDKLREEEEPPDEAKRGVSDIEDKQETDIYDKFSPAKKRVILAIVSYSAFISPVTSSIFLPSIPVMSADLNTTPSVINYTVAIFLVTIGIAPLFWSPLSGFYGRRPIYLVSMPIHVVASIGVALSNNVGAIIGTRILQGFGGSCVLAVGAGSVGDIYRPTERANAMGWYYCGALVGPSLAPLIGGLFTEYTAQSWRSSQYFVAGCGVLSILLCFFFLPETSHPPLPHATLKEERGKKFVIYWFNPFTSLGLFRWWNIVLVAFVSSCVMLETYCFVVPLATIFQDKYGVTNVAASGALYIANGGGNMIAGRVAGPYCDHVVRKYIAKRGYRRPEDRLRAAVIASGVVMPLSCIAYGWLIQTGAGGIAPPIVMMIFSAAALMFILTPLNTYLVDCMQSRSAELIAVNNFMRYAFAAGASALVLPVANSIGWGLTMTIAALISWLATAAILATLRWGHIWRERADAKYGPPTTSISQQNVQSDTHSEKSHGVANRLSGDSAHEHEQADEPGHLRPAPVIGGRRATLTGTNGGLEGGSRLARQSSTKGEMPPVHEVLKRTVSLSSASVHGG